VLPGEGGNGSIPADSRPDPLVFVGGDGNSIGRSAEQDAKTAFSFFNGVSQWMSEIRIVYGIFAMGAKVFDIKAEVRQVFFQLLFIIITRMVTSDRYRLEKIELRMNIHMLFFKSFLMQGTTCNVTATPPISFEQLYLLLLK
jgi:hypothetical protein